MAPQTLPWTFKAYGVATVRISAFKICKLKRRKLPSSNDSQDGNWLFTSLGKQTGYGTINVPAL